MKILLHMMDGTGHVNACLGMAQALAERGHDILFAINENIAGSCSRFGFREILLHKAKQNELSEEEKINMAKHFGKQLLDSGLLSGKSSFEKLACLNPDTEEPDDNFMKTLHDFLVDFDPQIEKILQEESPDCIIIDHFLLPPVIARSSIPWIFLYSGNPLPILRRPELPPPNSGYALPRKDGEDWELFREELGNSFYRAFKVYQTKLNEHLGYTPSRDNAPNEFGIQSPFLNIYQYPEDLDYFKPGEVPPIFGRVDAFMRKEVNQFEMPAKLLENRSEDSRILYLSLGSMGSYDVELMKRILSILEKTPHKVIVSKGPRGDEYDLPDNCWGENFLPQPNILPLVDLVITHGGNNTVTETFALGKPMIILPLFGDQYDNAQRLHELGFGIRLETYAFTEEELLGAIQKLLNDKELNEKLKAIAKKIETANSKAKVCEQIETIVKAHKGI